MKKVIFGILLTIIGLVGASVLFMSVFLVDHTGDLSKYGFSGLYIVCIVNIFIGMLICGISALSEFNNRK